jgi:hypothetical protein
MAGKKAAGSPLGSITESPAVAPGTIEVHVVNASNQPAPGVSVLLQVHRESVAEGNTDRQQNAVTDGSGVARFERLSADSAESYRLLLKSGGGQYGLQPFQLSVRQGVIATLRQLDQVNDVRQAMVAADAMVFVEPRDDVFQFEVLYRLYNVGQSVWVPEDVQAELPRERQAVNAQAGDDVQFQATDRGVRLVGAVAPGQHQVSFTFQVPRHNSPAATFEVGLLPNVIQARVGVASGRNTELSVDGFQEARPSATSSGQRLLVSGQVFDRGIRAPHELRFEIRGLPTLGSGRVTAAIIAGVLAALGLVYAVRQRRKPQREAPQMLEDKARQRLLEELAELERAKTTGTIGPRTYEDTRTTLIEALIRLEPATE